MKIKCFDLNHLLKDAASNGNEVTVRCYAGGPFELSITCSKLEDAPGYGYYVAFMGEDGEAYSTMGTNGLSRAVKDAFNDMGLTEELTDTFEIEESEMSKLGHKKEEGVKMEKLFAQIIREAKKTGAPTPYDLLSKVKDASYKLSDVGLDDAYWRIDSMWDDFKYTDSIDKFNTWDEYIEYSEDSVEMWREYLSELYEDDNVPEEFSQAAEQVLNAIDSAQFNAGEDKGAEEPQDGYTKACNAMKAIEAAKIPGVSDAYVWGQTSVLVELNDDIGEYEAEDIADKIESDILKNGRQHGRNDLQGMGEWHIEVGTVADHSDDSYDDLDPDVRDNYEIIIEPAQNYKNRRMYDGY